MALAAHNKMAVPINKNVEELGIFRAEENYSSNVPCDHTIIPLYGNCRICLLNFVSARLSPATIFPIQIDFNRIATHIVWRQHIYDRLKGNRHDNRNRKVL